MPNGNDNYPKEKDGLQLGTDTLHNRHSAVTRGGLEVVGGRSIRLSGRAFSVKRQFNICLCRHISWNRVNNWRLHNHKRRAARHRLSYSVIQKRKSRCYRSLDGSTRMPILQIPLARNNVQITGKSHGIS